ncbi:MAG: Major Facilitator Superfamily protein [Candidatus Izimaplasma bacterium HR2]|nr:MAG: Major Facilitator Superfamily protein [Candidatus Izimaplasma bacterium HR2]
MDEVRKIKKQVLKFSFYGFLKNLRFFDPYLYLYFIQSGLEFAQIGLLLTVREVIIYVFEVPSGVLADRFGKKTELILSFAFYIVSFILFYLGDGFYDYVIAMVFFGFGEAFRSGTHKAMIMAYLDKKDIKDSKSKVYGKTRSFSLIGSTVSSLISIIFIITLPSLSWLFIIAIVPYILDMILILTYPKFLNERIDSRFVFKDFLKENVNAVKYVFSTRNIRSLLIGSASYNAGFKSIKDYIQPVIVSITLSVVIFTRFSAEDNTNMYLGFIYAVIYLISAYATFNSHKLVKYVSREKIISSMWILSGLSLMILGFYIDYLVAVLIVFLLLYVYLNIRKPLMIEKIGDAVDKEKRASVLSIESQFTSLLIAMFAPVLGLIADNYSIELMLTLVGITMSLIFIFSLRYKQKVSE